jgi:hypothetical protein
VHLLLLRNHPAAAFLIQSKGHTGAGFPTVCAHSTIGSLLPIDSTSLLHLELGTVRCGPATAPWSVVARIRPVHRSPSFPTFEAGFQTWFSPSRWPCPKPSVSLAGCGGRARGGDFSGPLKPGPPQIELHRLVVVAVSTTFAPDPPSPKRCCAILGLGAELHLTH